MLNVSQSTPHVKYPDRLSQNVRIVLAAGYNVHVRVGSVLVNGVTVCRDYFEEMHPVSLMDLLYRFVGRPHREEV